MSINANPPVAISIQNISKRYGHQQALNPTNLSIHKGQIFGLLGVNGAGKSTLINLIAGLIRPSTGSIKIMHNDTVTRYRQARKHIGIVPQELIDEPFFQIKELLKLQSGYFSIKNNEAWINELLEVMELSDKANQKMYMLSGGMKRRVLIAMALVHKPSIVILDEPTAGVDIYLRKSLWRFINKLHQLGHTIILTTHYLEEAEELCDHIAIINKGNIVISEEKNTLLKRHSNKKLEQIFTDLVDQASTQV